MDYKWTHRWCHCLITTSCFSFVIIKQIESMLPWVFLLTDHRRCQNVIIWVTLSCMLSANFFCSYHIFVTHDHWLNIRMATWNLFVKHQTSDSPKSCLDLLISGKCCLWHSSELRVLGHGVKWSIASLSSRFQVHSFEFEFVIMTVTDSCNYQLRYM